jgi:hypothetical protein
MKSDVIRLIFLYEKIQNTVLDGASLSTDEANIIRQCATGLLTTVPAPAESDPSQFLIPF